MTKDHVDRFLNALSAASREKLRHRDPERLRTMAAEWERRLEVDQGLMEVDELDPAAAEHRAAESVFAEDSL
ncbi:hypothetical protein [Streptomyces sp. NPDC006879]|uniref:hypothetical protein n=1 Tax=Streptomyces sp. NPDC006879 TaxID=3364767 RepID=UPI00369A8B36